MAITLRTLVEDPRLHLDVVVDAGLDEEVRWVLTTELSDPTRYLHGGEVILTNGLWLQLGTDAATFVERVRALPIPALGFGLGDDGRLPADLVEACGRQGLTLFAVPYSIAFADICEAFSGHVHAAQQRAMRFAIDLSGEYLEASAGKRSVLGILDVLGRARSIPLHLLGPGPTLRSNPRDRATSLDATSLWRALRDRGTECAFEAEGWSVFPAAPTDRPPAFLLVGEPLAEMSPDTRLAIEQALIFLLRELRYEANVLETEQRFTNELVGLALAGPSQDAAVRLRLRALELDPDLPLCVITARETEPGVEVGLIGLHLRASHDLPCVAAAVGDDTVVIAQWRAGSSPAALAAEVIGELGRGFVLGLGVVAPDSTGLRASLVSSRQAVEVALAQEAPSGYACHSDLRSYDVLVALQDPDVIRSYCDGVLGPLEEYDRVHNSDLVATLERFLDSGGRWQTTADELFIHVNTLRHRVSRMEALTGRDLGNMSDRVDLMVALEARRNGARANGAR